MTSPGSIMVARYMRKTVSRPFHFRRAKLKAARLLVKT